MILSSALAKIAYGMVRADGEYLKAMKEGDKEEKIYVAQGAPLVNSGIDGYFQSSFRQIIGVRPIPPMPLLLCGGT